MSWLTALRHLFPVQTAIPNADPEVRNSRKWRLWQVEPTRDCNLRCLMCPWPGLRPRQGESLHMHPATWELLTPYLREVQSIDFTGSGEPLLSPNLFQWLQEAKDCGCRTGFLTNGLLLKEKTICQVIDTELDWIGFSIDAADKELYQQIRKGANFNTVCTAINSLGRKKTGDRPQMMLNFVIMEINLDQLEDIVRLAHELGIDRVNFKQCDVSRDHHGRALGLFEPEKTKQTVALKKRLDSARRLAKKLGIQTTAFSFYPDQQPVCDQDPRDSLFIRSDGIVAPCINLAYGGSSTFFGREVVMPDTHFGELTISSPDSVWRSEPCLRFRRCFDKRVANYEASLDGADFGHDLIKFNEAFDQAVQSMPAPPPGCRTCHYLYGV